MEHWGIFTDNKSKKADFVSNLQKNRLPEFLNLKGSKGYLFSPLALKKFIEEEEQHGTKIISSKEQALKTMSSGEQKKALWSNILKESPDYIILDNPFDNLDAHFQDELKKLLTNQSNKILFIQLASRKSDILPFIKKFAILKENKLKILDKKDLKFKENIPRLEGIIPPPIDKTEVDEPTLIAFKNVTVSYGRKHVLQGIDWQVKKGEFWQLIGSNGSGKTTIISMITGDSAKAFGQEIYLFGNKKGSGESVWEIKQKIGYFSPSMTDKFAGRHSIENMLISGLLDSIGLYVKPTEIHKRIIKRWLELLNLWESRNSLFKDVSLGEQRLVMTVRAMVKHPPLLILDEPTSGMDDNSAKTLVNLVNKFAHETNTSIIFVSHRKEAGLNPEKTLELTKTEKGSVGKIVY